MSLFFYWFLFRVTTRSNYASMYFQICIFQIRTISRPDIVWLVFLGDGDTTGCAGCQHLKKSRQEDAGFFMAAVRFMTAVRGSGEVLVQSS